MSQLSRDLENDLAQSGEAFSAGEVLKGLWLLMRCGGEVAATIGAVITAYKAATFVTGGLAALGLPFGVQIVHRVIFLNASKIAKTY